MRFLNEAIRKFKGWHSMSFLVALSPSLTIAAPDEDPSRIWIERPWEFRYIMRIESPHDYDRWRKFGQKELEKGDVNAYQDIESIFPLTTSITTDPEEGALKGDRAIGAVLMTFNQQAEVTSPYDWPHKLKGHLNRIRDLVLAPGNKLQDRVPVLFVLSLAVSPPNPATTQV